MTNYKLNIGLDNNSLSKLVENLNNYRYYFFNDYNIKTSIGEYNGVKELTAIVDIDAQNHNFEKIEKLCKMLCKNLNQECIAASLYTDIYGQNNGLLIYNDNYKGERYSFNSQYFLN